MTDIKLYNGDCIELMPDIPDKSVDLILCDPPYGITANSWDSVIPLDKMWQQYERIIKDKGNIILFAQGMFAHALALSNPKLYRYDLVWKKSKCGSPLTAKYMPMKRHEMILVFGQSAAYYCPQMTEGAPYHRKYTPNKKNNMKFGIGGVETNNTGTRYPISILDFPQKWRRQDQLHPTQKPVELMEYLIRTYCPENGTVLDNCMGSGSTGVGCVNTGRNFIGIELDKDYFKIAEDRISQCLEQYK